MMAVAVGARASRSVRGVACPRPPQASGFLVCVGPRAALWLPGPARAAALVRGALGVWRGARCGERPSPAAAPGQRGPGPAEPAC